MPEGHTIHRIARDHTRTFVGHSLRVSSPQGRFRAGARRLDGSRLLRVDAWGKHLFYEWDEHILHVHLGLYGKFRLHHGEVPSPVGAVRLRVVGPTTAFDLNGPTQCELIDDDEKSRICNRLGPDPLRRGARRNEAWNRLLRSRASIGAQLLNQAFIAGVGNVYRAEALFVLGVHPERPSHSITRDEFDRLWATLRDFLRIGVRYNRIVTADPKVVGKSLGRMTGDERLMVYKKEACLVCGSSIDHWLCGGRTIYACPLCQPLAQ